MLFERFAAKFIPEPNSGRWLWIAGLDSKGYGAFKLNTHNSDRAHRVSWRLYRGQIPEGMCVLHRCDTPVCVNPDHLFLGTRIDNALDRDRKGRMGRKDGEHNGNSKLTADQVRQIRATTGTEREIAKQFAVVHSTIGEIKRNKKWREG